MYVCELRVNSAVFEKAHNTVKISICIFHFSVNKIEVHICEVLFLLVVNSVYLKVNLILIFLINFNLYVEGQCQNTCFIEYRFIIEKPSFPKTQ